MKTLKLAGVVALLVGAVLIDGCRAPLKVDPESMAKKREELYKFEERDVTLVGNAAFVDTEKYRGAAVQLDDGTLVRVPEIKSWPTFDKGDEITIRGQLKRYTPTGTKGASVDEWFALEAVRWQKGDLTPKKKPGG